MTLTTTTNTKGRMMNTKAAYAKNDKVESRISGHKGVVIDVEREVHGDAFQVRFADGLVKWLRSTDLCESK